MAASSSSSTVTAASTNTTHADTMPIAATVEMKQEAQTASSTPSATADDETKGITQLVVRKPGIEEGTLFKLLYDELDPMPSELIAIIVEYDSYNVKGKYDKALSTDHKGAVMCLTQLDNSLIAFGSSDRTIKIWDLESDKCIKTLTGHENWVMYISQIANNQIVSGSMDNTIKIWDRESGECVKTLTNKPDGVLQYLIQLAKSRIASSGSLDNTLKILATESVEYIKTLVNNTDGIQCLTKLDKGYLASGSKAGIIKIWDTVSGKCVKTLTITDLKDWITCLIQLDNGYLASGSKAGIITILDPITGACIKSIDSHNGSIFCLIQLADGRLASGSKDGKIVLWK
jgi:WD40 repeat protein